MVTLLLDQTQLEVVLSPIERAATFHRENIRVARDTITKVQLTDDAWTWLRGVPGPGSHIPGILAAGTWKGAGTTDFVLIRRRRPSVVIDLEGDELYQRLIFTTRHGLALTGRALNGSDAVYAGLADHYVPSENLDALREALAYRADPTGPAELVLLFDETPEPSSLRAERAWIDEVFSADSVGEIMRRLAEHAEPAASETAAVLAELAPTGLAVTLDAVREARDGDLRDALTGEYRRVLWFVHRHPDLVEGIRAQLVDKDRTPRWQPATIAELDPDAAVGAREYVPAVPLFA